MGKWDYNNYIVEVCLRECVTDKRFLPLRDLKPTIAQYKDYCARYIQTLAYHPLAERIIRFFMDYNRGVYSPDKYNYYEPVKFVFDENDIRIPISHIAYPAGELYLKKSRVVLISITNEDNAFVWEDGIYLEPKRALPEFLTTIRCSFPIKGTTKLEPIIQLMLDIKEAFNSDYGKVYVQSTHEIIAK